MVIILAMTRMIILIIILVIPKMTLVITILMLLEFFGQVNGNVILMEVTFLHHLFCRPHDMIQGVFFTGTPLKS